MLILYKVFYFKEIEMLFFKKEKKLKLAYLWAVVEQGASHIGAIKGI